MFLPSYTFGSLAQGGDWLILWSLTDYSGLWNDSSLWSFSRWRLTQINDDAQTVLILFVPHIYNMFAEEMLS